MDVHHFDVSCLTDEVVAEALDDPGSNGDSEAVGKSRFMPIVRLVLVSHSTINDACRTDQSVAVRPRRSKL